MTCDDVREGLGAFADRQSPEDVRRKVEDHLETCPSCGAELERLRRLSALLDGVRVPPVPGGFAARTVALARERAAAGRGAAPVPARRLVPLRAAAALLAGLATGALLGLDTFRAPVAPPVAARPEPDPLAGSGLDVLFDAPSGSLSQVYAALMLERQGD